MTTRLQKALFPPRCPLAVGAMSLHIPGYRILRTLGKGGMATVYLAVQDIFERQVALKVMAQGLNDDPAFGKRFFAKRA